MRLLTATTLLLLTLACATEQYAHDVHWDLAHKHYQAYLTTDDPKLEAYHLEKARYYDTIAAQEYQIELQGYYNTRAAMGAGLGAAIVDKNQNRRMTTCTNDEGETVWCYTNP